MDGFIEVTLMRRASHFLAVGAVLVLLGRAECARVALEPQARSSLKPHTSTVHRGLARPATPTFLPSTCTPPPTHTHTHTRAHTRIRAHTHTHPLVHTHLGNGISQLVFPPLTDHTMPPVAAAVEHFEWLDLPEFARGKMLAFSYGTPTPSTKLAVFDLDGAVLFPHLCRACCCCLIP
jgi:hypothetical protein